MGYPSIVPEQDANREALKQVEKATESEPVHGEDLVESEDLKHQFREAKERLREPVGE
jgi:hypothetical protein